MIQSTSTQGVTGVFSLAGLRRMRCKCVLSHDGDVTHDRRVKQNGAIGLWLLSVSRLPDSTLSLMLNLIQLHCASATFAQSEIVVMVVMAVVVVVAVVLQLSQDPEEKKLSLLCDSKSLIPATLFLPSTPSMIRFWLMCFLVWRSLHSCYPYPSSSVQRTCSCPTLYSMQCTLLPSRIAGHMQVRDS